MNPLAGSSVDGAVPCTLIFPGRSCFGEFLAMAASSLQPFSSSDGRISGMAMPDRVRGSSWEIELFGLAGKLSGGRAQSRCDLLKIVPPRKRFRQMHDDAAH